MTIKIVITLIVGLLAGIFLMPPDAYAFTGLMLDLGLCLLLFVAGIDIGRNKEAITHIKELGVKILLVPFGAIVGSVLGGAICGVLFGFSLFEGGAIGAGLGWYTLAPIIITPYSAELGAISFLTNVFREVLAIILIPTIASKIGFLETISCSGATAMDTTLPIIGRSTSPEVVVVSFLSGVIMSVAVPILVPILISLG